MKILYVSQYFPPEMGAPAARACELARYWAQAGHEVTVLTGFPNHPTGVLVPEYRARFRRLVCREQVDGVRVVRTWLLPLPNRKPAERMLNYGSFCASAAVAGLFIGRPDIVVATSPQLLVGLAGWWLARARRVRFVFEVRDLWPESLDAVGVGGERSPLYRSLRTIASFLYRRADHIVVVTAAFKDHLMRYWGVAPERISVVQNGVDTGLFTPDRDGNGAAIPAACEDKFVVSYIGTMGFAHGLDTLLESASLLQHTVPELHFVLLGEGADKERLRCLARERSLGNITFLDQRPRQEIPAFLRRSGVCVVLLKKTEIFKTVVPTKMLEFMACARPIALAVDGQARKLLEQANAGIFVEPENSHALAAAILRLYRDKQLRETLGINGRRFILQHLSRESTAAQYLGLLQELKHGATNAGVPRA